MQNEALIGDFLENCYAEGLGERRVKKYGYTLKSLSARLKKDFDMAVKEDIIKVVSQIEKSNYADWTKHDYKVALKKFYKWLKKTEEVYPEEVRWIKTTIKRSNGKLPEGLLVEEEVVKLIEAATNSRDKALIAVLYESGCRAAELLSLSVKNVIFDKYGSVIVVAGKTGMRRVRLVSASPYLTAWLNNHPAKNEPESPLWISIGNGSNQSIVYVTLRNILERLAEKAGLKKDVNPHHFRHSRATHLASHLTEAQLCEYLGWTQGSEMPRTYIHMSGRDVDESIKKMYGLKEEEQRKPSQLEPKQCPRCSEINSATAKFCTRCSLALDIKIALELEEKRQKSDDIIYRFVKAVAEKYPKEAKEILQNMGLTEELSQI